MLSFFDTTCFMFLDVSSGKYFFYMPCADAASCRETDRHTLAHLFKQCNFKKASPKGKGSHGLVTPFSLTIRAWNTDTIFLQLSKDRSHWVTGDRHWWLSLVTVTGDCHQLPNNCLGIYSTNSDQPFTRSHFCHLVTVNWINAWSIDFHGPSFFLT